MKKFLILATALLAALTAGCSGGENAGFSSRDLVLTVCGETFDCDTNITQVVESLGTDYQYAEGKSCAYDGLDKTYTYQDATFYTNPLEEGDIVTEIYSESQQTVTSQGLTVGAGRQQVLDAYGTPQEDDGYTIIYRVSDKPGEPALCFELEGEVVFALCLTRGLI